MIKKILIVLLLCGLSACASSADTGETEGAQAGETVSDTETAAETSLSPESSDDSSVPDDGVTTEDFDLINEPGETAEDLTAEETSVAPETTAATTETAASDVETVPDNSLTAIAALSSGVGYVSGTNPTKTDEYGDTVFTQPYPNISYSFFRVSAGDVYGGLTVTSAESHYGETQGWQEVSLSGKITLTGYIKQYKEEMYSSVGDLEFYPDPARYPLPILSMNKKIAAVAQNNIGGGSFAFEGDTPCFRLGNINSIGNSSAVPDDGSYAHVTVTLDNIKLKDGVNGFFVNTAKIVKIS